MPPRAPPRTESTISRGVRKLQAPHDRHDQSFSGACPDPRESIIRRTNHQCALTLDVCIFLRSRTPSSQGECLSSLSLSRSPLAFSARAQTVPPPACRASPMRQRPSPNRLRRERNVVLVDRYGSPRKSLPLFSSRAAKFEIRSVEKIHLSSIDREIGCSFWKFWKRNIRESE